ncbi:MAG TPA: universal stress protein [Gaiellaceae bacterium]|nr:universal stress protein [Gaiellaceae bacterium]
MNDAPILICFDGSADAVRAIETSAELLGPHRAVVLDIGPPFSPEESLATLAPVVPSFEELNASQAGQVAARGAEIARASGFDAEARAAVAAPTWQGIVDVAHELDVPLIVIGSRGLSGLKEMIDGSLSHQVAEHAGRPVLITPPPNGS